MQRPNNNLFDRPPAKATRSSTTDVFVSPRLTSTTAATRRPTTPSSPVVTTAPTPTGVRFTTSTATPPPPLPQRYHGMEQQNHGEGTSAAAQATAPVMTASTAPVTTTTSTATTAVTPALVGGGADSTFAPPPFRGMDTEDADGWMARFEKYSTYRGFADRERLHLIAVLLRDEASDWYDSLEDDIKTGWPNLKQAFEQRFQNSELTRWRKANDLWQRVQGANENVESYITSVKKLAKVVGVEGEQLRYALQRGLRPQILAHVIQAQATTVDDLVRAARVAEAASLATATAPADSSMDRVVAELAANRLAAERNTIELQRFTSQLAAKPVSNVNRSRTPSPSTRPSVQRRVTFEPRPRWEQQANPPRPQSWRGRSAGAGPRRMTPSNTNNCQYCNGFHTPGKQYCRAANVECYVCKKIGHLARVCRSGRRQGQASPNYDPTGNFSG